MIIIFAILGRSSSAKQRLHRSSRGYSGSAEGDLEVEAFTTRCRRRRIPPWMVGAQPVVGFNLLPSSSQW